MSLYKHTLKRNTRDLLGQARGAKVFQQGGETRNKRAAVYRKNRKELGNKAARTMRMRSGFPNLYT